MRKFADLTVKEVAELSKLFREGCSTADIIDMYDVSYADADRHRQELLASPDADLRLSRKLYTSLKINADKRNVSPEKLAERLLLTVFENDMVPAVLNNQIARTKRVKQLPNYLRLIMDRAAQHRGMSTLSFAGQILECMVDDEIVDSVLDDGL